ncbi:hypothetical protein [Halodesulfovibrio spirochaetisodalis]|uniref:Phage abortive infection protein n=1 Tax=Halodesulfovibrio spirochaetisodalis TaxID=1560234 RepID=A0A1B7XAT3_9BACT|nr:hypothetical protein [Halodesulfovibrio spirochaetisodalis]OBQ46465.1 hypothetical protein SP90_12225 [Halodesulfovibrio spirochaetisodalis]
MKSNKWLPIAVTFCILALGIPAGLITIYHYANPQPFVSPSFPWGEYGSLYAGIFTLAAAALSLATLIYLVSFNREMQKENRDFIEQQSQLMREQLKLSQLESYINHKKLFSELLDDIERSSKKKFYFANRSRLYSLLFPNNNSEQVTTSYTLEKVTPDTETIKKLLSQFDKLGNDIKNILGDKKDSETHITNTIDLSYNLEMRYQQGESMIGDVFWDGAYSGINIFSLEESIIDIESVLNELLEFTGNAFKTKYSHKVEGDWLTDKLLERFKTQEAGYVIQIHDPHQRAQFVSQIKKNAQNLIKHSNYESVYRHARDILFTKHKAQQLKTSMRCRSLGDDFYGIINGFVPEDGTDGRSSANILHHIHKLKSS